METTEIQAALAGLDLCHDIDSRDLINHALIILEVWDHETGRTYPVVTHTLETSFVTLDGLHRAFDDYRAQVHSPDFIGEADD